MECDHAVREDSMKLVSVPTNKLCNDWKARCERGGLGVRATNASYEPSQMVTQLKATSL